MSNLSTSILNKTEQFMTRLYVEKFSDKFVFHDFKHIKRVAKETEKIALSEELKEEELEIVLLAAWFYFSGFSDLENFKKIKTTQDIFSNCKYCSLAISQAFLEEHEYDKVKIKAVLSVMENAYPNEESAPENVKLTNILLDAIKMDFGHAKGKKKAKLLYEEFLLLGAVDFGKRGWYEAIIDFLNSWSYVTDYGKKNFQSNKDALLIRLEKEYKELQKKDDLAVKQELGITDAELKTLKKNLSSVKGRDERGIQTIFRTTSKNHYTLNEMIDKKANIMISVNSIILSLILGGIVSSSTLDHSSVPIAVMTLTSISSVILAVLSIRPDTTHGIFTEEEVRNKQGNLLFFGNFYNMSFKDYEWGMLQMLNDSNYMYSTMIRDIYFLGQSLSKKYKYIRLSLNVFMIGIFLAVVCSLIEQFAWIAW